MGPLKESLSASGNATARQRQWEKSETVKGLLFGSATANADETEVFLARSCGSLDTWHGNPQVPASVAIN